MILPSIDLMNSKAVQLRQGRDKVLENENPVELAAKFSQFGEVAVIDLDAAFSSGNNETIISEICTRSECRVGGGIRSLAKADKILSMGAEKIIIGTMAFKDGNINRNFLEELADLAGREKVIIALDSWKGEVVIRGWQKKTGQACESVIQELENYASEFLLTRVDKEGLMLGTDLDYYKDLRAITEFPLTAAGGISSLEEITELAELGINSQLGMALYQEKIKLEEAFIASLRWKSALLPTITRDKSGQVLMLAYSTRESLQETFRSGQVCYFSRSSNKLWKKGETSGNVQDFLGIRTDCDGDALLITARQTGNACHTGNYSCFGGREFSLFHLGEVIQDRFDNPVPSSYTARLDKKLLAEKIHEESHELIEAELKEDIIWEAADLIYFTMVLLIKNKVSLSEVLGELAGRRRKSVRGDYCNKEGNSEKNQDR